MLSTDLRPAPDLAPFDRTFRIIESNDETIRTLVPKQCISIGFRYAGSSALTDNTVAQIVPHCSISGLRPSPQRMQTAPKGGLLVAHFTDAGAAFFLDGPLHQLYGRTDPLERWMPVDAVERASSQIYAASDVVERIGGIEEFLRGQWRPREIDPAVIRALSETYASHGTVRLSELATRTQLSPDTLETRFCERVGASTTQFAAAVRLRHATDSRADAESLNQLAFAAGFYNEARFITGAPRADVVDAR